MKKFAFMAMVGLFAILFTSAPVEVQVSQNVDSSVTVEVSEKDAEARSRSRSRSRSSSRSRSRSKSKAKSRTRTKPKSKGCAPKCSASGSKGKLDSKSLFKKGGTKPSTTKAAPKATTKKSPTAAKSKIGGKSRPTLSKTSRAKATSTRTSSLKSPKATKSRLTSQRSGVTKMRSRSRAQSRRMRASSSYYPRRSQYHRNRYWASYNGYGWGYGYRPGWTYHRGWGTYGYGYTRGGLGIVDYMVLYSIFGHNKTSTGQTVVNNNTYIINGEDTEVTAVPEGSRLTGFGSKKKLIVPAKDGNEVIDIPTGSTFTKTDNGLLITTPDGVAVLVPQSTDAYKAEDGYKVPAEASEAMKYEDLTDK